MPKRAILMRKNILLTLLITLISLGGFSAMLATTSKTHWCIVGGTRGAGYALAENLCRDSQATCTLFVRPDSAKKAKKLLDHCPYQPKIVSGDVTTDLQGLVEAASGAAYLVIAQAFPYAVWEESFKAMVANCIAAAQATGSTIIYYGRAQRYGLINPITETTEPKPASLQGTVLNNMEKILEQSPVSSIIIHHSYPFGIHGGDGLLDKNFAGIPQNKNKSWLKGKQKFDWIGSSSTKIQVTYLPDLAAFTRLLVAKEFPQTGCACLTINFAGLTLKNINEMGSLYAQIAKVPYELNVYSKGKLLAAAFMAPEAKFAIDSYDSFTHEILLDSSLQEQICPFPLTSLETALGAIYAANTAPAPTH